jgi:hypothetical protein
MDNGFQYPEKTFMVSPLKKKTAFFVFFISLWFAAFPLFADEGKEKESEREALLRMGRWEFDFAGQVRLRGDFAWNQNFTDLTFTPGHKEAQFLERTRLQGSVENHSMNLEAFVQVQWYGRWGGMNKRSAFDLYQGYIEWGKILGSPVSLKGGRQELLYGSAFFIGTNDFFNGLSWDGFKTSISPFEELVVDIIGTKMVKLNPGDPDIYLAGLYTTHKMGKDGSLEGYLFYNKGGFPLSHREFLLIDSGQKWFTLGGRFAGKVGEFDYELEPQVQWGKVKKTIGSGADLVRTYGGHLDLGYTFKLPWDLRIFGAYAYGSGDDNPFDGRYKEFHGNIFNDNYLIGDMSVITDLSGVTVNNIHASGMHVWVAGISLNPLSNFNLTLRVHRFIASKVPSGFSKDLGTELDLPISYKLTKGISFVVGLNKFYSDRFFEQASGSKRNIDYLYVQAQVEF